MGHIIKPKIRSLGYRLKDRKAGGWEWKSHERVQEEN